MQKIDVTQETKAQFRSDKKELETKSKKTAEEKKIGFYSECT